MVHDTGETDLFELKKKKKNQLIDVSLASAASVT